MNKHGFAFIKGINILKHWFVIKFMLQYLKIQFGSDKMSINRFNELTKEYR